MATHTTHSQVTASDRLKWLFFGFMGLCALLVIWVDERFLINAADPHWKHIEPVKWLLLVHGLAGITALTLGAVQFSSRLRRTRPALHRAIGKVYIGAVCVSAPMAIYMGSGPLEPVTIHVEQWFQGGFWLFSALMALVCIRNKQIPLHKAWMMRSYAFTLVFIFSRVPDAFLAHYSDQFLGDMLWSLTAIALVAPDIILTIQDLTRIRRARARKLGGELANTELEPAAA
jgi:uncharacterized membrane protein